MIMNIGFRLFKLASAGLLTALLAGCGGAPAGGSGTTNITDPDGELVDIELAPTHVSAFANFNESSTFGTGVANNVSVSLTAILSNLVSNYSYEGQVVEFVPVGGSTSGSCVITANSQCSVTWTSAFANIPVGATRITYLAMVPGGAEPFNDDNANGMYDDGELVLVDYPEPFRDDDFNGVWDSGEYYFDQNGNGTWDDANGEWDGPCSFSNAPCDTPDGIVIFQQQWFPLTDEEGNPI